MGKDKASGYSELLKNNPAFRNLWYGQIVSELGDWLNSVAIYALILKLTDSGMAMAVAMMAKLLPIVVISPLAGVIVDRVSRKKVMIVSDILRFFIVLCFLLVQDKDDLWFLYGLTIVEISLAGFFEPARSAIIPSLVRREDLVAANALSGSTWSVMLSFGAAIGGVVVAVLGIKPAFIIDAVTFLFSSWFISRISVMEIKKSLDDGESKASKGWKDLEQGFRYVLSEPIILAVSLLKSGLAVAGGIMTLIPLYSNQFEKSSAAVSLGIGIMYSTRGVGAALGPILVRRIFGDNSRVLQNSVACGFFSGAIFYFLFAQSKTLTWASVSLGLATMCGSVIWVFSTALIHMEGDKKFMGRIFSAELAMLTLVMGISNFMVGWATDRWEFDPHQVAFGIAILFIVPGLLWTFFLGFVRQQFREGKCVGSVSPVDPSGFNPAPTRALQK